VTVKQLNYGEKAMNQWQKRWRDGENWPSFAVTLSGKGELKLLIC